MFRYLKFDPIIFTIGYEKHKIEELLIVFHDHQIRRVVDVRRTPYSQVKSYQQDKLVLKLAEHGFEYIHFPDLAPPQRLRDFLKKGQNFKRFSFKFKEYLKANEKRLESYFNQLKNGDVLFCYEKNPLECHRTLLKPYIPVKVIDII